MAYSLTLKRSRTKGLNLKTINLDDGRADSKTKAPANTMYEKHMTMARESMIAGDRVAAEGYYQHAEHYLRLMNEAKPLTLEADSADNEEEAQLLPLDNEELIAAQTSDIAG